MERLRELLQGNGGSHILPFLWMKGEDNKVIGEELDKIQECGIREVCLEARPHPDFMGPGWWENLDFILEEAKKRQLRIWLLDDDKFPTGHANGAFAKYPDKKKVYLAERHMDICGPCRSGAVLVENFLGADGELLGILACPKPDGETLAISGDGIMDLTANYENGFVYFDMPEGTYRLFVLFTTRIGGGREDYLNLIDSQSVGVLIDEVYEKHYNRYKEYFGTTFAGFFSDEPELGNVKGYPFDVTLGTKDIRLPWSNELNELLVSEWGENFLMHLPALWYESGEKTRAIRSTYMDCMTRLVSSCFSGQIGSWCAKRGVEYIGHIIEDDNAHTRLGCSVGHYFREMKGQHMSGIDVVHHQIVPGFTEPVHQWIAGDRDGEFFHYGLGKLGSSAAHLDPVKKNRALCEIFGNYGWAEGNSMMKWLTNHMLVRGINKFTPHAFAMSYPERDCPPHFYARGNNPGFECFSQLMKYMNRASHILSGGVHLADAAILYHAEAEWSGGKTMYFHKPGRVLMEQQLDYDVIPADVIKDGQVAVANGCLIINEESYPCLILPYAQYLDRGVAEFIIEHTLGLTGDSNDQEQRKGVKVFVIDALPIADTNGKPLPSNFKEAVTVVELKDIGGVVRNVIKDKDYYNNLERTSKKYNKELNIRYTKELDVEASIPSLRNICFRQKDGLVAMYFNESITQIVNTNILVNNKKMQSVSIYDPWQNTSENYSITHHSIPLRLEPGEAIFLCLSENIKSSEKPLDFKESTKIIEEWHISKKSELETEFTGDLVIKRGEELPNLNGPGFYPTFTGTYRYESDFVFDREEGNTYKLLLPQASDSIRLWLNGQDHGCMAAGFPLRIDISNSLKNGPNHIVIEVTTTLVWKRKDGASTHLQVQATGIHAEPIIESYERK